MKHLRIRGHKLQHDAMKYSDRYTEYIERAKLLPFVTMARRGLPIYNSCALTALVDRWRVETHTFHLPCGEMTVTLEDWAMITGLPLDGNPVTGKIEAHKFRDMVEQLLGVRPPDKVEGQKGSKTGGLKTTWLQTHFQELPDGADDATVQRLYLYTNFPFPPFCYVLLFPFRRLIRVLFFIGMLGHTSCGSLGKCYFQTLGAATCLGCICLYSVSGTRLGGTAGARPHWLTCTGSWMRHAGGARDHQTWVVACLGYRYGCGRGFL